MGSMLTTSTPPMNYARHAPSRAYTPLWNCWSEDSAIKRWTRELTQAAAHPTDRARWQLTGQAVVVVEHEDLEIMDGVLHCVANMAGLAYRQVAAAAVVDEFPAWVEALPAGKPCLVMLEAGHWVGAGLEGDEDTLGFPRSPVHDEVAAFAFRQACRQFLLAGLPHSPVVIVIALKSFSHLDPALRRQGCFDRWLRLPNLASEDLGRAFVAEMGPSLFDATVTADLHHLGALVRYGFADHRRRGILQQALRRLHWRERRPVSFNDLVLFATYGILDTEEAPRTAAQRRIPAIHEAGHALVACLDAAGRSLPVYVSVSQRNDMCGISWCPPMTAWRRATASPMPTWSTGSASGLAGRAAEHLVLGAPNVTFTGAQSDLRQAHATAAELFANNGHAPDLGSDSAVAANLTILQGHTVDAEYRRIENLCRQFLQAQYLSVLDLLRQHRALLDRITAALMAQGVLFCEDLQTLLDEDA